jgi:hypothetical protein
VPRPVEVPRSQRARRQALQTSSSWRSHRARSAATTGRR